MWKPIHTFPHPTEPYADGMDTMVLLANASCVVIGYALYDYDDEGRPELNMWTLGDCWEFEPTHWAPLPEPPSI